MMSLPAPGSKKSAPPTALFSMSVSSPAPPKTWSAPPAASRRSLPSPPLRMSAPGPPTSVSLPAPPTNVTRGAVPVVMFMITASLPAKALTKIVFAAATFKKPLGVATRAPLTNTKPVAVRAMTMLLFRLSPRTTSVCDVGLNELVTAGASRSSSTSNEGRNDTGRACDDDIRRGDANHDFRCMTAPGHGSMRGRQRRRQCLERQALTPKIVAAAVEDACGPPTDDKLPALLLTAQAA